MKKKVLIIVFILIGAALISYFLWYVDKGAKKVSIAQHIPNNNDIVGTIDYSAIKNIIKSEMFQNPFDLLTIHEKLDSQQFIGDLILTFINGGINDNQKVIFSIADGGSEGSFFLIPLNDSKKIMENISEHLSEYQKENISVQNGGKGYYFLKQKIGIIINDNLALVAFGNNTSVAKIWEQVINKKNCFDQNNVKISELISSPDHISIWAEKINFKSSYLKENRDFVSTINFLEGKFEVSTTFISDNTYFSQSTLSHIKCDTCVLDLQVNMNNTSTISNMFGEKLNDKLDSLGQILNIDYSQLLNLCDGQLNFALLGEGIQEEKIITYEFDDDFNKVEMEKTVSSPKVNFLLNVGSIENSLYDELKRNGNIKSKNKSELFTNPLVNCYVKSGDQNLIFASSKELLMLSTTVDSLNYGVFITANFDALNSMFNKEKEHKYDELESFNFIGFQEDSVINFKLEIVTKNPEKNSLFDLVSLSFQ